MVRTLYLIRHGQSVEAMSGQKDYERPLTPMGVRDAAHMGKLLYDFEVHPDLMLSSPAARARTTAEVIAERLKYDTNKIEWKEELYEASVRSLFNLVNQLEIEYTTVVMVGHNPSFIYLAEYLTQKDIGRLVPCGVLQVGFNLNSWSEVSQGNGTLLNYYAPSKFN